jgi:hypothetical protein
MSSPATTGGKPIIAFIRMMSVCRPRKRPTAIAAPSGRPASDAMTTAVMLTRKLSTTISINSGSNVATSRPAMANADVRSFMSVVLCDAYAGAALNSREHDALQK